MLALPNPSVESRPSTKAGAIQTELHRKWYGLRNDTEALHSELKARHMRLPRSSVPQQLLHMVAYVVGRTPLRTLSHAQSANQPNALDNTA